MADASMPNMAAPFNALIQQNQQPAQNPLATMGQAVGLQAGVANAQRAGSEADDAALANAQNHLAYKIQALTPLLAKGPNISAQDVAKAGADAVADSKGIVSSDEMSHFITQLPTDGPGIQAALRQQQLRLIGAQNQIGVLRGDNADYDTGNGMNYGLRNAFTGVRTPQGGPNGFVPAQTSPAQRLTPANVTDANGQTTQTTLAQRSAAAGMDPVSGMPLQGAFPGGAKPQQALGPTMTSAASGGSGQSVDGIAGPGPSFGAGLDALNKDRLAASDTVQGMQPLLKALPLATALGTTGTGPGTKPYNDAKAFLVSSGIIKPDANVDMRNELDKYLAQAVAKSPLSGRSDMGTIVAQSSNPNTQTQTNPATVGLIKNAIIQSRMSAAAPLAFADNPSAYPQHKGTFLQNQDLRAYGLDFEPDGGRKLVQQMAAMPVSSPARTRFFESLKAAKMVGVGAGQQ